MLLIILSKFAIIKDMLCLYDFFLLLRNGQLTIFKSWTWFEHFDLKRMSKREEVKENIINNKYK